MGKGAHRNHTGLLCHRRRIRNIKECETKNKGDGLGLGSDVAWYHHKHRNYSQRPWGEEEEEEDVGGGINEWGEDE